ncbi:hypothetical protein [Amycolatopsis sp. NPDC051128]|uniref:hypothetical protein n=1 Tax=Amycolatopsis sp. NPDC051128 TaxID=3155412 RepID=UPI0034408337
MIVFVALCVLYLVGYRVTPPPTPPAPVSSTDTCPRPNVVGPTTTVGSPPVGGGAGLVARPARGEPCPAVTATMTVTAVPADQ